MSTEIPVVIRPATSADAQVLLEWRNDPTSRLWFRHTHPVTETEHLVWLNGRFEQGNTPVWIADGDGVPVGSSRVDPGSTSTHGSISVVVSADHRGRGFGRALIEWTVSHARDVGYQRLIASIHPENLASISLFSSCGFTYHETDDMGFLNYDQYIGTG